MADTVQGLHRFKRAFVPASAAIPHAASTTRMTGPCQHDFDLCLGRLGAHDIRSVLVGEWSAADVAAHFAGHQIRLTRSVTKLIDDFDAGDLDDARTDEDENATWVRQFEGLSREQVLNDLEDAFTNCHAAVEAVVSERQEAASMISVWIEHEAAHTGVTPSNFGLP